MKILSKTYVLFFIMVLGVVTSCEKDKMVPPTIDFLTTSGYTSADGHIALSTSFKIGVDAKRTEEEDDLKTFVVTKTYDGGTETTIDNVTLTSAQAGEFTKDYNLVTRSTAGTEKYSFTVTNRDGLITTKTITITVP
ncbi:MAG TPA: hypothetical protein VK588_11590 [Chitinophagaceae bacterium]|nr:hypothetical protein [Chitinophagaceae bacterium]